MEAADILRKSEKINHFLSGLNVLDSPQTSTYFWTDGIFCHQGVLTGILAKRR